MFIVLLSQNSGSLAISYFGCTKNKRSFVSFYLYTILKYIIFERAHEKGGIARKTKQMRNFPFSFAKSSMIFVRKTFLRSHKNVWNFFPSSRRTGNYFDYSKPSSLSIEPEERVKSLSFHYFLISLDSPFDLERCGPAIDLGK